MFVFQEFKGTFMERQGATHNFAIIEGVQGGSRDNIQIVEKKISRRTFFQLRKKTELTIRAGRSQLGQTKQFHKRMFSFPYNFQRDQLLAAIYLRRRNGRGKALLLAQHAGSPAGNFLLFTTAQKGVAHTRTAISGS